MPGDYNADNVVDMRDYVVWRNTTNSRTYLAADGNRSGKVDAGDYAIWRANFGMTIGSGAASLSAVPEPNSCSFLLLALAIAGCRGGMGRTAGVGNRVSQAAG